MKDYIGDVKRLVVKNTAQEMRKSNKCMQKSHHNTEFLGVSLKESQLHPMKRKVHRKFSTERTIDLHGLTQNEAFGKLLIFFERCQSENIKRVTVITGGNAMKKSILRSSFQKWIKESFGNYIVSCSQAKIWHGGQGAFYLILKSI
jgi:DNA-nicking Smr family endonuclease